MQSSMNGGDGTYSYSKNSNLQRMVANFVNESINEEIYLNLDVDTLSSVSNLIQLADLGCSTGPNTFIAMQNMLEAITRKHVSQNPNSKSPEFQVFFNDRTSNDFNTLLTSLPADRQYFAAAVPGSFHGRLFPKSSLHVVYSCHALHWLSKVPEEVLDKDSPAWNNGRIYYPGAPKEVYNAYQSQFHSDIEDFLNARATEIVGGGMMIILMAGTPNGADSHVYGSHFILTMGFMGSSLMEMAKEGLFCESLVDLFNVPIYYPCAEEMIGLVERNGHFAAKKVEFQSLPYRGEIVDMISTLSRIKHIRAGLEGMLSEHFGNTHMDDLFARLEDKLRENSDLLVSSSKESGQLFLVLKRK